MTPEIRALLLKHPTKACLECDRHGPNAFELPRRARAAMQATQVPARG